MSQTQWIQLQSFTDGRVERKHVSSQKESKDTANKSKVSKAVGNAASSKHHYKSCSVMISPCNEKLFNAKHCTLQRGKKENHSNSVKTTPSYENAQCPKCLSEGRSNIVKQSYSLSRKNTKNGDNCKISLSTSVPPESIEPLRGKDFVPVAKPSSRLSMGRRQKSIVDWIVFSSRTHLNKEPSSNNFRQSINHEETGGNSQANKSFTQKNLPIESESNRKYVKNILPSDRPRCVPLPKNTVKNANEEFSTRHPLASKYKMTVKLMPPIKVIPIKDSFCTHNMGSSDKINKFAKCSDKFKKKRSDTETQNQGATYKTNKTLYNEIQGSELSFSIKKANPKREELAIDGHSNPDIIDSNLNAIIDSDSKEFYKKCLCTESQETPLNKVNL